RHRGKWCHLASIREFAKQRIDRTTPGAVEQLELALGGGLSRVDRLEQRIEVDALVGTVRVETCAALQAVCRDLQSLAREIEHLAATERQVHCVPGHAVAQSVP